MGTTKNNHHIAQHKETKTAEILSAHALYSRIFLNSSDLVILVSKDLLVEYANPCAIEFFKKGRQNGLIGSTLDKVFTNELYLLFCDAFKKVNLSGSQLRVEFEFKKKTSDGMMMELTIVPEDRKQGRGGCLLFLRDTSQDRQIQALVHESQKMEALQYFVSGTTKEIQYPLLAILKKIEGFQERYRGRSFEYVGYKEFSRIIDFLNVIHKQMKACYETTAKLTNINKKRLKFESHRCNSNEVIRALIKVRETNPENSRIKFRLRLSDKLPFIALGEIEFNEIINHLVDNALQSMPANGHLTISSSVSSDKQAVNVEIIDDGVGISAEDLPHIFEPFFTTKQGSANNRAGLGLPIVYSLLKSAHGQIKVKSNLRNGTSVHLTFPVADDTFARDRIGK